MRNIFIIAFIAFAALPLQVEAQDVDPPAAVKDSAATSYMLGSGMRQIDSGVIKEVLKSDLIMLNSNRRYRLDNVRIPPYIEANVLAEMKTAFEGKSVTVYTYHDADTMLDRYGVPFAHVVADDGGTWIQDYMVGKGLAWASSSDTSTQMIGLLKRTEEKARAARISFWKDPSYAIKTPETVGQYKDSYQIVEGKILSVAWHNNTIFFNFGRDWRTDFTVKITKSFPTVMGRPYMDDKTLSREVDPSSWKGRTIRIRGWVTENNGPLMTLTHREQLDLIRENAKDSPVVEPVLPDNSNEQSKAPKQ